MSNRCSASSQGNSSAPKKQGYIGRSADEIWHSLGYSISPRLPDNFLPICSLESFQRPVGARLQRMSSQRNQLPVAPLFRKPDPVNCSSDAIACIVPSAENPIENKMEGLLGRFCNPIPFHRPSILSFCCSLRILAPIPPTSVALSAAANAVRSARH